MISTFVSYAHQDKKLAGEIKQELIGYGFGCFLAHEDINPSATWQRRILRELQSCDVFLGILTGYFDKSDWTHQETGIAYSRREDIVMLPVCVTARARGFLRDFQEVNLTGDIPGTCYEIACAIAEEKQELARSIHAALILRLEGANTFNEAGALVKQIVEIDKLASLLPEDVNKLLRASAANNQVYASWSASRPLKELLQRHKGRASKRLLGKFYSVWSAVRD